jgi:hypothetical protein
MRHCFGQSDGAWINVGIGGDKHLDAVDSRLLGIAHAVLIEVVKNDSSYAACAGRGDGQPEVAHRGTYAGADGNGARGSGGGRRIGARSYGDGGLSIRERADRIGAVLIGSSRVLGSFGIDNHDCEPSDAGFTGIAHPVAILIIKSHASYHTVRGAHGEGLLITIIVEVDVAVDASDHARDNHVAFLQGLDFRRQGDRLTRSQSFDIDGGEPGIIGREEGALEGRRIAKYVAKIARIRTETRDDMIHCNRAVIGDFNGDVSRAAAGNVNAVDRKNERQVNGYEYPEIDAGRLLSCRAFDLTRWIGIGLSRAQSPALVFPRLGSSDPSLPPPTPRRRWLHGTVRIGRH